MLTRVFPPQVGGSGRWLWDIYSHYADGDFVVVSQFTDGCESFDRTHNLPIIREPWSLESWGAFGWRRGSAYWRVYRRLRRITAERNIKTVHAARTLPEGFLAWMLKRRCGLPYVIYAHGEELSYVQKSRELTWMARQVLRDASLMIANSRNTARLLMDDWSVPDERIRVLHPVVDVEQFRPAPRDEAVRRRFGWNDRRVILTVGRLQERKGQKQIIEALPAIRRAVPDVLYAIVGDGDDRGALSKLANELGVSDRVQLLGELPMQELVMAYQQCDLFALANRNVSGDFEGFGIVLLEAQACGKPVIAGASGGTAEAMDATVSGRIVDPDRPQELVETAVELLTNDALSSRMGAAGRDWITANFDLRQYGEKVGRIFHAQNPRIQTPVASSALVAS